ncbi:MAG: P1 family peptidase [Alphaproteobacteria bacterium]
MPDPHLATPSGKPRARALGVPFDGTPGRNNAITDVAGVEVGYATIIRGDGALVVGEGPVRTGVTAILPRGRAGAATPVFAGCFSLNGNGELTGAIWIEEAGRCEGPITITNTHSCGLARDATIRWLVENLPQFVDAWGLPVAGETYDGYLNDINGFHVREAHVFEAIDGARGGAIEEGSVGGGTGMTAYEFKAGSGTASRLVEHDGGTYTVGAFVQANFGMREELTIAGVPVGRHLTEGTFRSRGAGSIIAVVASDAPLLPHQLKRLARRIALGVGRSGSISHHGSGDIFLAFSTANAAACDAAAGVAAADFIPDLRLDPIFAAVAQATDEAIVNALVANQTMTGRDGHTVLALPHDELRAVLKSYNRLAESA